MAKIKVLMIDDEKDFLSLMSMRIKSWGYELATASDGRGGIEAVRAAGPHIIILDYMLPDMDGVSVLKEIRAFNKEIPVIMFTAYPDTHAMEETKRLGVNAFIPKLSIYTEILPALKSALDMISKKVST